MVVTSRNVQERALGESEPLTLWRHALRVFGLSWWARGEVVHVPKPYGREFEQLRTLSRGWRKESWPKGGLYAYRADLDDEYLQQAADSGGRRVVLTLETLPELEEDLRQVNTADPDSVVRFLSRWGLLGVGVPSQRRGQGNMFISKVAPGTPVADSAELTHRALTRLQAIFRGRSLKERLGLVAAGPDEVGGWSHQLYLTLDFQPAGPQLGHCTTEPITAFLVGALCSVHLRPCQECGALFEIASQDKKFCSTRCRVRAHRRQEAASSKKRRRITR
jgi:hypothetical protein